MGLKEKVKKFLPCNSLFGLLTKVKKESGNSLWCTFSAWFSNKNVPYLIYTLSMDKVSLSYLFSFLRYQTKYVIKLLFRQLMMSQTLGFIFHQPLKKWLEGRKRGEDRNTKFEYLENEKNFLNEIKSIFHSFWRAIVWREIKIW